jgi:hypothetical protein
MKFLSQSSTPTSTTGYEDALNPLVKNFRTQRTAAGGLASMRWVEPKTGRIFCWWDRPSGAGGSYAFLNFKQLLPWEWAEGQERGGLEDEKNNPLPHPLDHERKYGYSKIKDKRMPSIAVAIIIINIINCNLSIDNCQLKIKNIKSKFKNTYTSK